jgi:hypothetical protein
MSSYPFPMPGTMSFGNATGVSPNYDMETFNDLSRLVPGGDGTTPFGVPGPTITQNTGNRDPYFLSGPPPTGAPFPASGASMEHGVAPGTLLAWRMQELAPNRFADARGRFGGVVPAGQMPQNTGGNLPPGARTQTINGVPVNQGFPAGSFGLPPGVVPFNPNGTTQGNIPFSGQSNAQFPGGGSSILDPKFLKNLDKTYGKGFGATLSNMLGMRGGWNPQVANMFMQSIEPYFQEHMNDIMELFGASGQRFASTAALGAGKFAAQFTAEQQRLFAQMYMWAFDNYQDTLMAALGYGQNYTGGNKWGTAQNILGMVGAGAGAASAGMAAAGATAPVWLAALAAL